jgi:NodT family efflux transporter outer membrane factor (OMF) lipoprotein
MLNEWWTSLNDETLSELERRALAASPTITGARARLRQARASVRLDKAQQLPSAGAMAVLAHAELPDVEIRADQVDGSGAGGATRLELGSVDFFNLGFDASWEVDLFGGRRRTVEASVAAVQAAEANIADAQVQLTADVAQTYVNLRDRQTQLALRREAAQMQRQMLALTRQRFERGAASALDVERLQTQLDVAEAQIVPLEAEIEALKDALALLAGEQPGKLDQLLEASAAIPLVPAEVRVGDPAALLQRRPDIRAAERQLASRTARIGVAEASRFPRLSLFGLIGLGGTSLGSLGDLDRLSAIAMPQLQWQFLDFGRGAARVEQAQSMRDEAEAQYREVVLAALKDAEGALSRFGHRRRSLAALAQVRASAARAAALMQQRYQSGAATLIDALDAEHQRVSAEQNMANVTAALANDYVALHKALGLGWSVR